MNKLKQRLIAIATTAFIAGFVLVPVAPAHAVDILSSGCTGTAASSAVCKSKDTDNATTMTKTIITTILYILGIIAVLMIIIGGIKYTTSNGDSSGIQSAKNTILYAVVGLVIAIMSFAIVNFVIDRIK